MGLFAKKKPKAWVSAVVVAAGAAARMEGIDKQRALIDEIPVVVRSITQLEQSALVSEVVLVCRPEQIAEYYSLVQEFGLEKVASVVGGGDTRQDSVFRGVRACDEQALYYAIHDGARPLVTLREIDTCILAAMEYGAAAVGTPVKDTIKVCGEDGFIRSTPDRERLAAIQTPQVFSAGIYREAMARAQREHAVCTDDCQLVERCGHRVLVTPGSYENIKITTPEDLALAQTILNYREQGVEQWQISE